MGRRADAYETARAGGLTGRVLNHFFQKAFQAAKEIRTRTEIGRGAVSIKSAAVELVGRIFEDDLAGRAIMVIGAGQMAKSCVRPPGQKRHPLDSDFQSLFRPLNLAIRCGDQQ
jgi:glutamyl-tRNA reductase